MATSRAQIEASLGPPTSGNEYVFTYETPTEKISVWYGGAKPVEKDVCRWSVSNEILFKFVIAPKQMLRLSEMNIDLTGFQKEKAREMVSDYYYYNENQGVTITTRMIEGGEVLLNIERGPDLAQRKKYCSN